MNWRELPIVAFDTETTGLEPFNGDRVIEFAAVVFRIDEGGAVVDRTDHSFLVNPEREIPRKVTEITGIRDGDVAGAPTFREIAQEVHGLLARGVTVAHNYPFDLAFLSQEFERAELVWPEPQAEIDTVDLSMKVFPDARGHKLSDLTVRLNVELEQAHRATDDAAACGLCFLHMAKRAESDLQEMVRWARGVGRPPEGGPIGSGEQGRIVFLEGEHKGKPVAEFPLHLAWMTKSKVRRDGEWQFRYAESVREWAWRWLDVRGSGRAKQNAKVFHSESWMLDPCITLSRHKKQALTEQF